MICKNDILFNVLYGNNKPLLCELLSGSVQRLQLIWNYEDWSLPYLKVTLLLLLDVDMGLKTIICEGKYGMSPFPKDSACCFFLNLREEVIEPYFKDSTMTMETFLDNAKSLYLLS